MHPAPSSPERNRCPFLSSLLITGLMLCLVGMGDWLLFAQTSLARGGRGGAGPRGAVASSPRGNIATGPRGGVAVSGPGGGGAFRGPQGGAAVRGPYGNAAARGPQGGAAVRGPRGGAVRGPQGGAAIRGPGGAAVRGPNGNVVVAPRGRVVPAPPIVVAPPIAVPVPVAPGYYGYSGSGVAAGMVLGAMLTVLPATAIALSNSSHETVYLVENKCYKEIFEGGKTVYKQISCP